MTAAIPKEYAQDVDSVRKRLIERLELGEGVLNADDLGEEKVMISDLHSKGLTIDEILGGQDKMGKHLEEFSRFHGYTGEYTAERRARDYNALKTNVTKLYSLE